MLCCSFVCNYSNVSQPKPNQKWKKKKVLRGKKSKRIRREWVRPHRNLQIGLPIEAGCGDVTGAVCTIWRQQHQISREGFVFGNTNDVTDLWAKEKKYNFLFVFVWCLIKHIISNAGKVIYYVKASYKKAVCSDCLIPKDMCSSFSV